MFLITGILENAHDIWTSEKRRLNNSVMPFKTIDIRRSQWARRLRGDWMFASTIIVVISTWLNYWQFFHTFLSFFYIIYYFSPK